MLTAATILGSGGFIPTGTRETSSLLLLAEGSDRAVIVDAGTGLRRLITDRALLAGRTRLDVLLTHFHIDHVCGLAYLTELDDLEITVRGPMVARGALSEDGWLHTGDRGRLDDSGLLHVEGRLGNLIVTAGENVAAEEVEHFLAVLDPATVLLGGGVAAAGDLLLEPLQSALDRHLPARRHRPQMDVRLAVLGNDAGLIGAADLARGPD